MSVGSKSLFALLVLWVGVAILCVTAEGRVIAQSELDTVNVISFSNANLSGITNIWGSLGQLATWNFSFLQTDIGAWLRVFLCLFSAAILLPITIDVVRLLFKPFS